MSYQPHVFASVQGYFTFPKFYADIVAAHDDGAVIVEVGTFYGQSIIYLAEVCRMMGKHLMIYGVDPFEGSPELSDHGKDSLRSTYYANIEPFTDLITHIELPSVHAASQFHDASVDVVFIDGAHDYESVKADIAAWLPKVKKGGMISGHDYHHLPVRQAVNEAFDHVTPYEGTVWGVVV